MILDRKRRILPRVRRQCANCPECNLDKLETVLRALGMTTSIVNVPGVIHVNGSKYAVAVNGARLEFNWSEPNATDLNLICPEATE